MLDQPKLLKRLTEDRDMAKRIKESLADKSDYRAAAEWKVIEEYADSLKRDIEDGRYAETGM